ncbi:MAG TPA: VPLPA-CTERM sorting domain-containing protein [Terriglobales bacterium]|nr:VPLPA-CTERM sorting domain-containing protein [Terriglobales bacterium]
MPTEFAMQFPPPRCSTVKRWTPWLVLLALFAVALPNSLRADPIAVGSASFIFSDSAGLPGFEINNFTGSAASCAGSVTGPNTYCYPVTTPLVFDGVTLTVDYSDSSVNGGATQVLTISAPSSDDAEFSPTNNYLGTTGVDYGDPTYAFQVPGFSTLMGGTVTVLSATITGTFSPSGPLLLTDSTNYFSSGSFSATLTGLDDCSQGFCYGTSTDLVTDASGSPGGGGSPVPEPSTAWLLFTGLAGLALVRRRFCGDAPVGSGRG